MANGTYEKIADGYLYNLWNGKLKEYKGEIWHMDEYRDMFDIIRPERSRFIAKDEHGQVIKRLECANFEGEIYNKGVWLRESNRKRAAEILIRREEGMIAKLQFQIKNHEDLIESLKVELT